MTEPTPSTMYPEVVRALGEISVQFATLEMFIEDCCKTIGKQLPAGCEINTLKSTHSFSRKCDALAIYMPWFMERNTMEHGWTAERFDLLMRKCSYAADQRNQYAHAIVSELASSNADLDTRVILHFRGRNPTMETATAEYVEKMLKLAKIIYAGASEAISLLSELLGSNPRSPP